MAKGISPGSAVRSASGFLWKAAGEDLASKLLGSPPTEQAALWEKLTNSKALWDYSGAVALEECQTDNGTERNTGSSARCQVWDNPPLLAMFA